MTAKQLYLVRQFDPRMDMPCYWMRGALTLHEYTTRRTDATPLTFSKARAVRDRLNADNAGFPKAPKHELELV